MDEKRLPRKSIRKKKKQQQEKDFLKERERERGEKDKSPSRHGRRRPSWKSATKPSSSAVRSSSSSESDSDTDEAAAAGGGMSLMELLATDPTKTETESLKGARARKLQAQRREKTVRGESGSSNSSLLKEASSNISRKYQVIADTLTTKSGRGDAVLRPEKSNTAEDLTYGTVSEDCIYEGGAKKEGGNVRNWKSRWLVLSHRHLLYYDTSGDESGPPVHSLPLGVIYLDRISDPEAIQELPADHRLVKQFKSSSTPFMLELPLIDNRFFHIRVRTHKECVTWIKLLQMQAFKLFEKPQHLFNEPTPREKNVNVLVNTNPWYTDWDGYIRKLPPILPLKTFNSPRLQRYDTGRPTSPLSGRKDSFMYAQELRTLAQNENQQLRQSICEISSRDVFHETIKELLSFVKTTNDKEAATLVSEIVVKCDSPYSMLSHTRDYSVGVGMAKPLDLLINEINRSLLELGAHPIARLLSHLADYYQGEADRINTYGAKALTPPVSVWGIEAFIGKRILHPSAVQALLREGRDNKFGLHAVIAYNNIHWKRSPGWPAYEFAVDALNKLVSGKGSPPAQLLKVTKPDISGKSFEINYQASKTVEGVLLQEVLENKPELLGHLDPENYSMMFFLGLITNLQDGKADNFIVKFNDQTRLLEIVGIDNDHAFADAIVKHPHGGHTLNIRNLLYFLPHCKHQVNSEAREKFLTLTPSAIVLNWLLQLHSANVEYELLKEDGVLTELDFKEMHLPSCLKQGEAARLFQRINDLRTHLLNDKTQQLTHFDLLNALQPETYIIVKQLLATTPVDRPDQGFTAFKRLFKSPVIEADDDLKTLLGPEHKLIVNSKEITFKEFLEGQEAPGFHDYSRLRSQTIAEAISQTVSTLDFTSIGRKSKKAQEIIFRSIFPTIPLPYLTLVNSDRLTDFDLDTLFRTSKDSLKSLDLTNCNNITIKSLKKLSTFTTMPSVILRHCLGVSTTDQQDLKRLGINIRMTESQVALTYQPVSVVPVHADLDISDSVIQLIHLLKRRQLKDVFTILISMDPKDMQTHRSFIRSRATVNESLHAAVELGQTNLVKILVTGFGLDVNAWSVTTYTPLQLAAKKNDVTMCDLLISLGADIFHCGAHRRNPLEEAIISKSEQVALLFLQRYGDKLKFTLSDGSLLLHSTISNGLVLATTYIIDHYDNYPFSEVNAENKNALHIAGESRMTDVKLLKLLLEIGIDLHKVSTTGLTPIMSAAIGGNIVLAKVLLSSVADPSLYALAVDSDKRNLIHLAAFHLGTEPNSDVIKAFIEYFLLKFPGLLESKDYLQRTPLITAAKYGNVAATSVLLQRKAEPMVADVSGSTPLHYVVVLEDEKKATPILQLLLDANHTPTFLSSRSNRGLTALGRCAMMMHKNAPLRRAMCTKLMSHGCSLKYAVCGDYGGTILHYTVQRGAMETLRYLLEKKIALDVLDEQSQNALHIATTVGYLEIVKLLLYHLTNSQRDSERLSKGVIDQKNAVGETPLMLAVKASKKQEEMVRHLLENGSRAAYTENDKGESPMDVAQRRNLRGVISVLMKQRKFSSNG